jgi:LysM repeat protein
LKKLHKFISSGGDGAEAIYALRDRDTLARIILEEIAKTGQNIRKWYQRRLPDDTSKDYYFIHRNTGVTEPIIVEYGFLDNASDAAFLKSHMNDLANAVVKAVALYKGIPYTVPAEAGTYTVVSGDTLWSVARKFNVSVDELKSLNNLTTNSISVGQVLKIPGYIPPTQTQTTYVVQKGDSLWSIASAFNTTTADIMSLNNLTSTTLSIGQELKIPSPTTPTTPITPTNNTYTVQSGDSLWTIANKFGVTVTELRSLNNLTSDILSVGQVLLIPIQPSETPSGTTTYTVKSGDNLYSIANKYGVTVTAIKEANNLTTNTLSIGQVLTIPLPGSTEPPVSNIPPATTYTVKSGDNLYSIAAAFGTTVDAIKSANNLTSNLLSIGQVLTIPTTASGTTRTYTVKSGDSLWTIANKFGTTVDSLRRVNNLKTDLLDIGQVLIIP